jgi:hypothetical protein
VIIGGSQEEISSWRSQVEPCHHVSFLLFKLLNHHAKVPSFLSCVTVGIPKRLQLRSGIIRRCSKPFSTSTRPNSPVTCCRIRFVHFVFTIYDIHISYSGYTISTFRIQDIRYLHFVFTIYDIYILYSRYTISTFCIQDIRYLRFVFNDTYSRGYRHVR